MGLGICQIQLGNKGYLDVSEDVVVPITYSSAPIQDITVRSSVFSKTITLPRSCIKPSPIAV